MWKLIVGLLAALFAVGALGGCSTFQKGSVKATNGRTHQRHVIGIGWNSDNYFYLGDPQSFTNADTEAGADFSTNGAAGGDPVANADS